MTNFDDMRLAVESLSGGKNTVRLDDLGMPSILVPFPRLNYADVITGGTQEALPAFIVDGRTVDAIHVSKYHNIIVNGRAYSLPMQDPAHTMNFDRALQVCRNKGAGWHLITNALWAAIALWCRRNGTMPRGNNSFGQDVTAPHEKGVPSGARDASGNITRTATGSGPASWYHNWNDSGIADLNGNVWDWCAGLRIVDGEIQIIPYGNAMRHDCNMSPTSTEWRAIMPDGTFVAPGTAGTLRYTQTSIGFHAVTTTPAATGGLRILQGLGLLPEAGLTAADYESDHFWSNLTDERLPLRGGGWINAAPAGVFALSLSNVRAYVGARVGFRAAFYE